MKTINVKMLAGIAAFSLLLASVEVEAQDESPIEAVQMKGGKMLVVRQGKSLALDKDVTLPGDIKVATNGTFTVQGGKERKFQEGELLRADGTILKPDGSIMPVVDHVTMKNGRILMVKDGESAVANQEITLGDGSRITPDAMLATRDGRRTRILDGQIFRLDGSALPAKDTITLKDGKVVVHKDGSLLQVQPRQSIMMSDGTKVFGDGSVITKDGKKMTLTEGQIVVLEGVVTKR